MTKSKAKFDKLLAIDVETSGIALGEPNPVYNATTGERYQVVSIGLVVADTITLKPVDRLYLTIKYDSSKYVWSEQAERVHGLSRDFLEANGVTAEEAVVQIVTFLEKYFGPAEMIRRITLLGHNVGTFDKLFFEELFHGVGLKIQLGNRHIDTFSLGVVTLEMFSSDELFDFFGLHRDPNEHNALDDALHALTSARMIKKMFNQSIAE